jgi:hypothetical protein
MRISILLACLLCLYGCASDARPAKALRGDTDSLCVNDCLGTGGTREFCTDRCSY